MTKSIQPTKKEAAARARGRLFIIGFVVVLLAVVAISLTTNLSRLASGQSAPLPAPMPGVAIKTERLEIDAASGRHVFAIEVMRSDAERSRGLMFRQFMPADHGMLFDFVRDQVVTMWMKNTHLPLDMVFVFADGRIHRIEERTEPMSERTISSGVPVRSVLELNAGTAARLGLKPGDRLIHAMFKP